VYNVNHPRASAHRPHRRYCHRLRGLTHSPRLAIARRTPRCSPREETRAKVGRLGRKRHLAVADDAIIRGIRFETGSSALIQSEGESLALRILDRDRKIETRSERRLHRFPSNSEIINVDSSPREDIAFNARENGRLIRRYIRICPKVRARRKCERNGKRSRGLRNVSANFACSAGIAAILSILGAENCRIRELPRTDENRRDGRCGKRGREEEKRPAIEIGAAPAAQQRSSVSRSREYSLPRERKRAEWPDCNYSENAVVPRSAKLYRVMIADGSSLPTISN